LGIVSTSQSGQYKERTLILDLYRNPLFLRSDVSLLGIGGFYANCAKNCFKKFGSPPDDHKYFILPII
jgi:hypothetical protein